jgi:hypothetical protein
LTLVAVEVTIAPMKVFVCLLVILSALLLPASAAERVHLYARLTEDLLVELTDGSKWRMDKGDCFPVIAYKEAHTKLILQLAGSQFMVPAAKAVIVPDKEVADAVVKYRANVNTYISGYANRWRTEAEKKPQ